MNGTGLSIEILFRELPDGARQVRREKVTIQQVCALAALTVRKHLPEGKNPIGEADLEWVFACNGEGTEQLRAEVITCKQPG